MNESSPKSAKTANNLLNAGETLALLDRLRQSLREAVQRTAELDKDFTTRASKLRAQLEQSLAAESARWTSESENLSANKAAQQQHVEEKFLARKDRITRALENARTKRFAQIEGEEGKHTFDNQRALLDNERTKEVDTQKNKANYESFTGELANERAALDRISNRARATFSGFGSLARLITHPPATSALDTNAPETQLLERLREHRDRAARELARTNALVLPLIFRLLRLWIGIPLILVAAFLLVPELRRFDFQNVPVNVWAILGGSVLAFLILHFLGRLLAAPRAKAAVIALHSAYHLADVCAQKAEASFKAETERIQSTHATTAQKLNDHWKHIRSEAKNLRSVWTDRLNDQARTLNLANEEWKRLRLKSINEGHDETLAKLNEQTSATRKQLETTHAESLARITATRDETRATIDAQWQQVVLPTLATLRQAALRAEQVFPPWQPELWKNFRLPDEFAHAAKFGSLAADLEKLCEVQFPEQTRTALGSTHITVPLLIGVPNHASVLFETKQSGQQQVIGALNNLVLRLLTSAAPGRLAFTIFDPVGLGQNFAGIMHLADFEERLINSRIWTQQAQIEQRLADLNEHIEKVTQMYLRNEYASLAEYNAQAGRLAEKYHFLVIADFPTNFSDVAVKRLQSIAASGPRCGVHLLIHWDQRKAAPVEFVPEELHKNAICIVPKGDGFAVASANWDGVKLSLDAPPDPELATHLLQQIGKDSTDSYRVEMPFAEVAPDDNELWSLDTTNELRVPIGRTGATKLQYLALGQGTRQHGLVAGKTGSGKSTLFHVIITNLSLWCSPEQVEFYLVDFKKGVEFKTYASHKLPHARVVAIESDREFGLSVLQRVDDELKRRGDLFRKHNAQNIAGYKSAGGAEPMPRVLLLIDEFQELFVEDDRVSQGAALLLDRIVRQGRAFGIHVLLGSQTLGGAYTLARATIGQMVVRIALQTNEADAYLIMSEDNPAPRLLSRPGEAIYNDDGGAIQGNSPFQVVWLPDRIRDEWLDKASALAASRRVSASPIIFEGNAPASIQDNPLLNALLHADSLQAITSPRAWLGAPNSIKGPTEVTFRRQSGNHLLVVGQREETALGMVGVTLISLATQLTKTGAQFLIFDCSAPDSAESKFLSRVARLIPHGVKLVQAGDVDEVMAALAIEQQQRAEGATTSSPETFLFIHGLQRNKKLRFDEEMSFSLDADAGKNPGLQLNKLICEGGSLGFHVIATCDSYNNVMRMLSRKALSEFEMRVVFQMSANDSASLIESPAANDLGLHRAILYNGQQGWTETFRPYALPDNAWLDEAGQKLAKLHS
ncbi:MAG TPA: FtsK/SpoIIIE domain-containing protein [Verrucomicrobiae bacterium]|nr:FtsK/SpoIIIE domain-containing protein [Verrucomicrobiae bacterium]